MQQSAITEEMRSSIGVETKPYTFVVESGGLRRFLHATGDANPLYWNLEAANTAGHHALAVPPTFFCPDAIVASHEMGLARPRPFMNNIDGGTEWELFAPIHVGDVLTLRAKVTEMREKQGSAHTGRMILSVIEITCHNEKGDLTAIARGTSVSYEGSKSADEVEHRDG